MKIIDLVQGSREWHAHRATHFNASDAPAMMGVSPYTTRTDLMTRLKTGITTEVDAATQRRFDDGHRFEALARTLAEGILGEELYPVTASKGKYSASFDGLNLEGNIAFEHKTLNDDLRSAFAEMDTLPLATQEQEASKSLHPMYRIQMEQQCMVSGCDRVLFMASKWNGDELVIEYHCWYFSDPALRAQIIAGWEQFEHDLKTFEPAAPAAPTPTGKAPDTLPTLRIEVTGQVTFSNLSGFKETALAVIRSVNRELETDQDFADAEASVKWCADVERRADAAKEHALSQTASIDQLFKSIDDISAEARSVRLELEKLVKNRKEALRMKIVNEANAKHREHIDILIKRIGMPLMPTVPSDYAVVIKGKRSITSIQDAVDTELARVKIAANEIADRITLNLRAIDQESEHTHLFPDFRALVLKQPDDLAAVIDQRIAKYKQDQEDASRRESLAELTTAAVSQTLDPRHTGNGILKLQRGELFLIEPAADTGARIKLGDINARIAPLSITADGLAQLGFVHVATDKNAKLYRESDFPRICEALIHHIEALTATA